MPFEVVTTPYGRPALHALHRVVTGAKAGDPLAPVTVVVPANHVGVTARRLLAGGRLGPLGPAGRGVAGVTFLTVYRLAELLGASRVAATGRRPVSTPVLTAAVRRELRDEPGMFAPVAEHPATEAALVVAFGELSDVSAAGLDALARAGRRAHDVVGVCRRARALLGARWYDEVDLTEAAIVELEDGGPGDIGRELGHVVIHLPQELRQTQARLLAAVSEHSPTTVIAGLTGQQAADVGVLLALRRLGCDAEGPEALAAALPTPRLSAQATRILTASDADDEVRAAVRAVVDAARDGTPLERIAILFPARQPYGRLVHEHLAAAGVARNGAAVRPLDASVAGRTLLDLLALPDHDFRRADVVGLLDRMAGPGRGAGRMRGRPAPAAEWQRLTREAGVVAGRDQWSRLLDRLAREIDRRADAIQADLAGPGTAEPATAQPATAQPPTAEPPARRPADERHVAEVDPERQRLTLERLRRRAQRARDLRALVLDVIDEFRPPERPMPWSRRAAWLRRLAIRVLGDEGQRDDPRDDEWRAAHQVDAALDRLASLDDIDAPPTLDVFRRTLELELDADLGRVGRFGEGVLVGPLSFAVGLDLDLVIVLGMAEGTLPGAVRDDSLLPDGERRRAAGELPLRRDRVGREHRQLLAALAAAERHLLCAPRGDLRASSDRVPSRWLLDAATSLGGERVPSDQLIHRSAEWITHVPSFAHAVTHTAFPATEQEYRLRADGQAEGDPLTVAGTRVVRARRSRAFTRFDGNLASMAVPSPLDEVVSSTRLESWASCPFAYFVRHLLGVEPLDVPERQLTITAIDRGSLVHQILERFIGHVLARQPDERPAPDARWSVHDHELIERIAAEVIDDYEARGLAGREVFWRSERARLVALAHRFLREDDDRRRIDRSHPVAAELRFGYGSGEGAAAVPLPLPDGRTLHFRGAADRVDVTDSGTLYVVDYKTGTSDRYRQLGTDNPDDRGTKLQLTVYGQAARAFWGDPAAPVEARYWFVSDREGFRHYGYTVDQTVVARVSTTLGTIVDGIERGAFPAHPDNSGRPWVTCPYCDPDGLGVADLRREWERKRDDPAISAYAELAEPRPAADEAARGTSGAGP